MNVLKQTSNTRRAFTLLELMMVVTIIGLLMSMSVVVMYGFIDQAEEEATSATIQKINRLLEERVEGFDRAFKGVRKDTATRKMRILLADPNVDGDQADGIFGVKDAVVDILAKKALFRFEFPQRFDELLFFGDPAVSVPGLPQSIYLAICAPAARVKLGLPLTTPLTDAAIAAEVATTFALGASSPETESSELLYFALIKSGSLGAAAVDSDRFTENEIRDTDGDGLPEFVDNWGQPLRYYRWPTRLIDVDPPVPFQPYLTNLADPTGTNDPTDVALDLDNNGTFDIGQRTITKGERDVANLLLKGLPPAPSILPSNAMPRDLLLIDPDDPVGRLYAELEHLNGTNGKPTLALEYNEAKYHTPDTFHAPLVVSAGPDGVLGLFEPNDTTRRGNLALPTAYDFVGQMPSTTSLDGNNTHSEPADIMICVDQLSDNITSRNKLSGGRQ